MAILEAFAWGVAVIATPVGSVPEVVEHNHNGLIVPVGDVAELTQALRRLIADPDLRRSLGEAARRDHTRWYDINGYLPRLVAVWRNAVAVSAPEAGLRAINDSPVEARVLPE